MDFMDLDSLLSVIRPAISGLLDVDEFGGVRSWAWAFVVLSSVEVRFALGCDTPCGHII